MTGAELKARVFSNVECAHKVASHIHGTRSCYVLDKCRCALCRLANLAGHHLRVWSDQAAQFDGAARTFGLVDASDVIAHIEMLRAHGLGLRTIAKRANVAHSAVVAAVYGRNDRNGGVRSGKMRVETASRILAIQPPRVEDLAAHCVVDVTPSLNRIRALHHLGWSVRQIAIKAGCDVQRLHRMSTHSATLQLTHCLIAGVFADLWNTPFQPSTSAEVSASTRARRQARKNNWPSPLDLDDDGYVLPAEDEFSGADVDEIAIDRVLSGEGRASLTSMEVNEVIRRGYQRGLNATEIARRLGMHPDAVHQRAKREGLRPTNRQVAA